MLSDCKSEFYCCVLWTRYQGLLCSFSMNNTNNNCNNRFGLDFDKTISSEFRFFLFFARLFLFYGFGLLKRSSEQFPLVAGNSRCCRLPAKNTVFKDFSLSAFLSSNRNFWLRFFYDFFLNLIESFWKIFIKITIF